MNLSLDDFAEAVAATGMAFSRSTLVRIEGGKRRPKESEYRAMAQVSGLPYEFFVVPDLAAALNAEPGVAAEARLSEAERRINELQRDLRLQREEQEAASLSEGFDALEQTLLSGAQELPPVLAAAIERAVEEGLRRRAEEGDDA